MSDKEPKPPSIEQTTLDILKILTALNTNLAEIGKVMKAALLPSKIEEKYLIPDCSCPWNGYAIPPGISLTHVTRCPLNLNQIASKTILPGDPS